MELPFWNDYPLVLLGQGDPASSGNEMVETAIHSAGILFFKCVVEVRA